MHFEVEHVIRIPFDKYFETVLSEKFNLWVKNRLKVAERAIVRHEEVAGKIHRTLRVETDLSERARKWLKVNRLIIDENMVIDKATNSYTWEYIPNVGVKRFTASGTGRIAPSGEHVKRTIAGDITVRFAIIGSRIEKRLVEWAKNNMGKAGEMLEEYHRGLSPTPAANDPGPDFDIG